MALRFSKLRPFVRALKSKIGIHANADLNSEEIAASRLWDLDYYDAAAFIHRKSLKEHGDTFDTLFMLGRCLQKCNQHMDALEVFRKASKMDPNSAGCHYEIGKTSYQLGVVGEALEALKISISADRQFLPAYILLARVLIQTDDLTKAKQIAESIVNVEENEHVLYILVQVLLKLNEIELAEKYLIEHQEATSNSLLVRSCLGQIAELKGQHTDASNYFSNVLEEYNTRLGFPGQYSAGQLLHMARQLQGINFYTLSAFAYSRALEMYPEKPLWRIEYGTTLYKLEQYESALEQFQIALNSGGTRQPVLFELGKCYLRTKDFEQAKRCFEELLEADSKRFDAKVELARLHRNLGNFEKAKYWIVGVPAGMAEDLRSVILGDMHVYEGAYDISLPEQQDYVTQDGKVLHVLETSLPHKTSGYTYRSHYILTNQRNHGFDVTATTRPGFPADVTAGIFSNESVRDGILYRHCSINGSPNYNKQPLNTYLEKYARFVLNCALLHQPEIIQAASNFKNGLAAAAAARALNIPWVYELRGIWEDTQVSKGAITEESDRYKYFRAAETYCLESADAVVTISTTLKEEIAARGIDPEKIFVVPNAVDSEKFPVVSKDRALASELGLDDAPVIGYISSLVAYEGIDLLIRSFKKLVKTTPEARLLIVGGGDEFENLKALSQELGIEDRVVLTGRIPHTQVLQYYSLIDIFVVPRLPWRVCEIVTPLKPYEAMATGRAVVVSDVSALKEMILDGQTGLTFKAGSDDSLMKVLKNLLRNPEQRVQLGKNAAEWVRKNRTWEMVTREYQNAYDFALKKKNACIDKKVANS